MSTEITSVQSQCCVSRYHNWVWDENRYALTKLFLSLITFPIYIVLGFLSLPSLAGRACCSKDATAQKVEDVTKPLLGTSDRRSDELAKPDPRALELARESGEALLKQIEELRSGNEEGWQQEAMNLIIKARLSNPHEELQRLIGAGIINKSYRVDGSGIEVAVLMAQALEIKNVFGDTHYVFLHGQPSSCAYLPYLLKEVAKRQNTESDFTQFEVLRPLTKQEGTIQDYSESNGFLPIDLSPKACEQLLSVDASLFSGETYESALHFVTQNTHSRRELESVAVEALHSAFPKATDEQLKACVREVRQNMPKESPCGNLFVACIPKNQASTVFYRSHPYGLPCKCKCFEKEDPIKALQQGKRIKCGNPQRTPQYRLFMPEIQPGKNQHIYMLTPQGESNRQSLEKSTSRAVDNLVAKLPL